MNKNNIDELVKLAESYGCQAVVNADIKPYSSFKIGGMVALLIKPNSAEACTALMKYTSENNIRQYVLGKCTNVLIDDRGVDAVFFMMTSDFGGIELSEDGTIRCDAGTALSKVCTFALENGLTGLEFAYGIPGSVGGAVYMNAGAYGGDIASVYKKASALNSQGIVQDFTLEEADLSYRHSAFMGMDCTILSVELLLKKGNKDEIKAKMDELLGKRKDKQPLDFPSAGSTFKRPEGSFASLLIDQCGLKGLSVGGAQVSTKHSGFVINRGGATFDDVIALTDKIKAVVKAKTGYILECEPIIISDREEFSK